VRVLIAYLMMLSTLLVSAAPVRAAQGFTGAEVYAQSCAKCHSKGTGGAPRPHEIEQWRDRLSSGRANLLRSVLRGKGEMPPKGGNASLSVREVSDALDFMLPARGMLTRYARPE
jgi:cytochrome c5